MWRTCDGDRVLTDGEWGLFAAGLDFLRGEIERDLSAGRDDTDTGVRVFDALTPEQKLALLAEVALALRDPVVPAPRHTAVSEGAIVAVLNTIADWLRSELGDPEIEPAVIRPLLRAAVAGSEDCPGRLPRPTSREWDAWDDLLRCIEGRLLWDCDYEMGDVFLDLPPDVARVVLRRARIDPDYYLAVPAEPDARGLRAARRTLTRLIGYNTSGDDL